MLEQQKLLDELIHEVLVKESENYYHRGKLLLDKGWSSPFVLDKCIKQSDFYINQVDEELSKIEVESIKQRLTKGQYASEFLNTLKKQNNESEETPWADQICHYYKSVMKAKCLEKEKFRQYLNYVNKAVYKNKKEECLSVDPFDKDNINFNNISSKNILSFIESIFQFPSFGYKKLNNQNQQGINVWYRESSNTLLDGIVLDSKSIYDKKNKSGRLDFSYFIGGNKQLIQESYYNPKHYYTSLPEFWFPISKYPFFNIYSSFENESSLYLNVHVNRDMFYIYSELIKLHFKQIIGDSHPKKRKI
ncbi:hypothetical protein [Algibacillus agarilyticus]|uniref:hypothetical protein n=1 Tax=Algibacillus agarilyticus TaxID=2234133 RepID=UPI000DD0E75A|nr:hypothetical protein [Algibacillus agarilyticus]